MNQVEPEAIDKTSYLLWPDLDFTVKDLGSNRKTACKLERTQLEPLDCNILRIPNLPLSTCFHCSQVAALSSGQLMKLTPMASDTALTCSWAGWENEQIAPSRPHITWTILDHCTKLPVQWLLAQTLTPFSFTVPMQRFSVKLLLGAKVKSGTHTSPNLKNAVLVNKSNFK